MKAHLTVLFACVAAILSVVRAAPVVPVNAVPTVSCDGSDPPFAVLVDQFAQLVSIHWQFDHLDEILQDNHRNIASQVQKHMRIKVISDNDPKDVDTGAYAAGADATAELASASDYHVETQENVDFDILEAQILGAIQAHTEGQLPVIWESLGENLGRMALETRVRDLLMEHCSSTTASFSSPPTSAQAVHKVTQPVPDGITVVSVACLAYNAKQIADRLDAYVEAHLSEIFSTLDRDVVPRLLQNTQDHLEQVLDYFNTAMPLPRQRRLGLEVMPWSYPNLASTYSAPSLTGDNHPVDFVSKYACLARI